MNNAKALVLVSLLSVAGLAQADACCQEAAQVVAPDVATEVAPVDPIEAAKAKKLADDIAAADAAQAQQVVVADKE